MSVTMSAKEVLATTQPGDLFIPDKDVMKSQYTKLMKRWHPDVCGDSDESNQVTAHINTLYAKGIEMLESGTWKQKGLIRFSSKDGRIHQVKYIVDYGFELGRMYIGNNVIVYILSKEHKALYDNAVQVISNLRYDNDKMKEEFSRYLPQIIDKFETSDDELGLVVKKTPELILLRDVLGYYNGIMPDRHVAWVQSRLLNIACYLDHVGLSHNGITLDTCFVSPEHHTICLLGGWWYATPQGSKMRTVSSEIFSVMPPSVKSNKVGSIRTDLESMRLIGRQLLGDRNGTRLLDNKAAPEPMIEYLRSSSSDKAVKDFRQWDESLTASFGKRKFVVMDVDVDKVYKR